MAVTLLVLILLLGVHLCACDNVDKLHRRIDALEAEIEEAERDDAE